MEVVEIRESWGTFFRLLWYGEVWDRMEGLGKKFGVIFRGREKGLRKVFLGDFFLCLKGVELLDDIFGVGGGDFVKVFEVFGFLF